MSTIGELVVVAINAENLRKIVKKENTASQDPFCVFRLGNSVMKTKTDIRGGKSPVWDDQVNIKVPTGVTNLIMQVFDKEMKKERLIAEGSVDITTALRKGEHDGFFPLRFNGLDAGRIYLELTFYAASPSVQQRPAHTGLQGRTVVYPPQQQQPIRNRPPPSSQGYPPLRPAPPQDYRPRPPVQPVNTIPSPYMQATPPLRIVASTSNRPPLTGPPHPQQSLSPPTHIRHSPENRLLPQLPNQQHVMRPQPMPRPSLLSSSYNPMPQPQPQPQPPSFPNHTGGYPPPSYAGGYPSPNHGGSRPMQQRPPIGFQRPVQQNSYRPPPPNPYM